MITIVIKNKINGQVFEKNYYDLEKVKNFIRKCKYSKKVMIIAQLGYETATEYEYCN